MGFIKSLVVGGFLAWCGVAAGAAITVSSLDDDIFVDGSGATFSDPLLTTPVATLKCTLRMAIAAANLNVAVGGCAAGATGADNITFSGALTFPAVITLANHASRAAPPSYPDPTPLGVASALIASESLTLTGPGPNQLTIDATAPGRSGFRALLLSDGNASVLADFQVSGVNIVGGRVVSGGGGCLFSSDHVVLNNVWFNACSSVGDTALAGFGGAAGFGNTNPAVRPNISLTNVRVTGSRAERGSAPASAVSQVGGVYVGSASRHVGQVHLTDVAIMGNMAELFGGLWINNASNVAMTEVVLLSNTASGEYSVSSPTNGRYGGARISNVSGSVTVNGGAIVGNTAWVERAGLSVATVAGSVTVSDLLVSGNVALNGRIGGAEFLTGTFDSSGNCLAPGGAVNLTNVSFDGNRAALSVGGFLAFCSGAMTLQNVSVGGNEVSGGPAYGPFAAGGSSAAFQLIGPIPEVTLQGITVADNVTAAFSGSGGFATALIDGVGSLSAQGVRVRNNRVDRGEAGLTLRARHATRVYSIRDSEFTGNVSQNGSASALFIESVGDYRILNSTVAHNIIRGTTSGGTIFVNANAASAPGVQFRMINTTVARNRVEATSGFGEALHVDAFTSPSAPGGPTPANSTVSIQNGLLAGRAPDTPVVVAFVRPDIGSFTGEYTLLETSGGSGVNFCIGTGVKCNQDALIENAVPHEGLAMRTMPLRRGSPALDAGNNAVAAAAGLTFDQRGTGFPRVVSGTVDMGAYESSPLPPVTACNLDIDGDAQVQATKEGLVLLRSMLGLNAAAAVAGTGITEAQWNATRANLNANCGTSLGG